MAETVEKTNVDFLLVDDLTKDINSISCGEIWHYHYKEVLIGVRDLENSKLWLLKPDKWEADGYTHRHEITEEVWKPILAEVYPHDGPVYLNEVELADMAFRLMAEEIGKTIDRSLGVKREKE